MIRDFFADLELRHSATLEDVKQSYRRLARRFHPDLNPRDQYAAASFLRISEAYESLSTNELIERHRQDLSLVDDAEEITQWTRVPRLVVQEEKTWPGQSPSPMERRKENLDLHVMISLTAEEVRLGSKRVKIPVESQCPQCFGAGGDNSAVKRTCKTCAGLGYQTIRRGAFRWKKTCDSCVGKGFEVLRACPSCEGCGKIRVEEAFVLEVPRQMKEGRASIYKGKGHGSLDGKTRGDLWVNWRT